MSRHHKSTHSLLSLLLLLSAALLCCVPHAHAQQTGGGSTGSSRRNKAQCPAQATSLIKRAAGSQVFMSDLEKAWGEWASLVVGVAIGWQW